MRRSLAERGQAMLDWLRAAQRVPFAELREVLAGAVPALTGLEDVPQDPLWHAEGNVAVHSALVVERAHDLADEHGLHGDARAALILAAALHDVGKAVTTRRLPDADGVLRWRSPRHPARGRDLLALALPMLGLPPRLLLVVLELVVSHHRLHPVLDDERRLWPLARRVPLPLLVLLARADARGRVVAPGEAGQGEDAADLLEVLAREQGLWQPEVAALCWPDPYAHWPEVLERQLPGASASLLTYALRRGIRDFEEGQIHTPHEAAARAQAGRGGFGRLTVMVGPSGSGKSTLAPLLGEQVVSLDALRAELGRGASDQAVAGQVLQAAREALRSGLRARRHVVWDATSLRASGRAAVLGLGFDYAALTELAVVWTPADALAARNAARSAAVPGGVLTEQLRRLEWPDACEAHQLTYFLPDGETLHHS